MAVSDFGTDRYARLRQAATFRNGGFARWSASKVGLFGGGALGAPIATGIVKSGASVGVFDFDLGTTENQGTQLVEPGVPKVETVVAACDAIEPGRAHGYCCDVRHAGVGVLDTFDLLIDATDDPNLALPLTEISNGLGKVLLRCALDGSGQSEMGRVLCSSAATGHACQICHYSLEDLRAGLPRTACPDGAPAPRRPTIASNATAMMVAGFTLLSAERVATGNDAELVLGRESIIDLSNLQILPMELRRSEACLSGHCRWELIRLPATPSIVTLADLFQIAAGQLAASEVALEGYLHPLYVRAECPCGDVAGAVGTEWSAPPRCRHCHAPMAWRRAIRHSEITRETAAELGILKTSLTGLGFPEKGAMFVARCPEKRPLRYILEC
jgi:hypothetical protein